MAATTAEIADSLRELPHGVNLKLVTAHGPRRGLFAGVEGADVMLRDLGGDRTRRVALDSVEDVAIFDSTAPPAVEVEALTRKLMQVSHRRPPH